MPEGVTCREHDLFQGVSCWLLWGLPAAMVVAGGFWPSARPWLWTLAFALAGGACLVNARRCGRRHCYLTGPVLLVGALAALLHSLGWIALSWQVILDIVVVGALVGCALECCLGRYVRPA